MLLVRDILEEIKDHVGGHGIGDLSCSEESKNKVLKVFNEAQRLLMNRGDFEGTEREISMDVRGGCITLDRRIETIKQYLLNGNPGRLHNDNFKFLQQGTGEGKVWYSATVLEDCGDYYATMRDLPTPMAIMAVSDRPEMAIACVEVMGVDQSGREVSRHWDTSKGYRAPIIHATETPYFTAPDEYSSGMVSHISALNKTRTVGYVSVYGYLPGLQPIWLTTMAPDETSTQYRRYRIPGVKPNAMVELQAKVSLRWVKQYPSDIALIQSIDAFVLMAKALNARDSDEIGLYAQLRNSALSELKLQRAKKHPASSATLNIRNPRRPIRNGSSYGWGSGMVGSGSGSCPVPELRLRPNPITGISQAGQNGRYKTTLTALPSHRAVYVLSNDTLALAGPVVSPAAGVISGMVDPGGSVFVHTSGAVSGFTGLTAGVDYYLGAHGTILPVVPSIGTVQKLGRATSESILLLDIQSVSAPCGVDLTPDDEFPAGFLAVANLNLSGHKLVMLADNGRLILASPTLGPAIGLIQSAASEDEEVLVYQSGPVTGFSGLVSGETYYMAASGAISTTPVSSGWSQSIGVAEDENTLIIDLGTPFFIT